VSPSDSPVTATFPLPFRSASCAVVVAACPASNPSVLFSRNQTEIFRAHVRSDIDNNWVSWTDLPVLDFRFEIKYT